MDELKSAGASRVVVLVKEDIGNELSEFQASYWSGEVLVDTELAFFKALGGGRLWNSGVGSVVKGIQTPISSSISNVKNFTAVLSSGAKMNLRGEGTIGGGCFVLNRKGQVVYSFLEKFLGDQAPLADVIEAVRMHDKVTLANFGEDCNETATFSSPSK